MRTLLVKNAKVISNDAILANHAVLSRNDVIETVMPDSDVNGLNADEIINAGGMYIAPGYIDLHIHGTRQYLVEEGREHLEELCKLLPQYGVTGFLPTVCPKTSEKEDLELIGSLSNVRPEGASILGFLFEGHFLALTGALPSIPKNARNRERVRKLIDAAKPYNAVFCISPELEGIQDLLPVMTRDGIPAFITHTAANLEETEKAISLGAVHATHFYDVFPYPGEKDPGVRACGAVEEILSNPDTSVDFILDGEHVEPAAVKMAIACKGPDKVCLITDANINAGLPPGRYKGVCGLEIDVLYEGGPARCSENSFVPKILAGSGLTMDKTVKNAVKFLNVSIPQAVKMASLNPARVLRLADRKGLIRQGYDADMVMLDNGLNVIKCWVKGKCVFSRQ